MEAACARPAQSSTFPDKILVEGLLWINKHCLRLCAQEWAYSVPMAWSKAMVRWFWLKSVGQNTQKDMNMGKGTVGRKKSWQGWEGNLKRVGIRVNNMLRKKTKKIWLKICQFPHSLGDSHSEKLLNHGNSNFYLTLATPSSTQLTTKVTFSQVYLINGSVWSAGSSGGHWEDLEVNIISKYMNVSVLNPWTFYVYMLMWLLGYEHEHCTWRKPYFDEKIPTSRCKEVQSSPWLRITVTWVNLLTIISCLTNYKTTGLEQANFKIIWLFQRILVLFYSCWLCPKSINNDWKYEYLARICLRLCIYKDWHNL